MGCKLSARGRSGQLLTGGWLEYNATLCITQESQIYQAKKGQSWEQGEG
jgi:hypothetical protein